MTTLDGATTRVIATTTRAATITMTTGESLAIASTSVTPTTIVQTTTRTILGIATSVTAIATMRGFGWDAVPGPIATNNPTATDPTAMTSDGLIGLLIRATGILAMCSCETSLTTRTRPRDCLRHAGS